MGICFRDIFDANLLCLGLQSSKKLSRLINKVTIIKMFHKPFNSVRKMGELSKDRHKQGVCSLSKHVQFFKWVMISEEWSLYCSKQFSDAITNKIFYSCRTI